MYATELLSLGSNLLDGIVKLVTACQTYVNSIILLSILPLHPKFYRGLKSGKFDADRSSTPLVFERRHCETN